MLPPSRKPSSPSPRLAKAGIKTTFDAKECRMYRENDGGLAAIVPMARSGLYRIVRDVAGAVEDSAEVRESAGKARVVKISVGELPPTTRTHLTCCRGQAGARRFRHRPRPLQPTPLLPSARRVGLRQENPQAHWQGRSSRPALQSSLNMFTPTSADHSPSSRLASDGITSSSSTTRRATCASTSLRRRMLLVRRTTTLRHGRKHSSTKL